MKILYTILGTELIFLIVGYIFGDRCGNTCPSGMICAAVCEYTPLFYVNFLLIIIAITLGLIVYKKFKK